MRALLVVDLQNDFCEDGALPVPEGNAVAARVVAHLRSGEPYDLVVTSQDWHLPGQTNGGHFGDPPDYLDTWPQHCIAGTEGAELHPELTGWQGARTVVRKGMGAPAYSAFEGIDGEGRTLDMILKEAGVDEVVVCGLATDYCVRATALDAVRRGFTTVLRSDLAAAVGGPNAAARVAEEVTLAGVVVRDGVNRGAAGQAPSVDGLDVAISEVEIPQEAE